MTNSNKLKVNKSWTLFLDRDGVINKRLIDDYVKNWDEFEFLPGVLEAISGLSKIFGHIFVVTNQQGIGKNVMTIDDLQNIHTNMVESIKENGGFIDRVYFCSHLKEDNCPCRKPKTGMYASAITDFDEINLLNAIMVGDTESDIKMAKNGGIISVIINEKLQNDYDADYCYSSLNDFYKNLVS